MSPSHKFNDAASYLSTASSLTKVSTTVKLELYGLFKYITVSQTPSMSRPSVFDMTGRAKWDAWSTASKIYSCGEDAEARYLEIAHDLGWIEGTKPEIKSQGSKTDQEDIWDDDNDASPRRGPGASGGMGGFVSTMAPPPAQDDHSIHGLAVSDDATGLSALLEQHPEINVNERDEYGYTALHLACDRGNLAVVKLLLSKGADTSIKDPDDLAAAELARISGHHDITGLLSVAAA